MTREEAIELLTHMMMSYIPKDQYGDYDDPEPYEQAVDMAIEALTKPQGDYISRADAVKKVATYIWHLPNYVYQQFNGYNVIEDVVADALQVKQPIPMFKESEEAYKAWTEEEMDKYIKAKQKEVGAVADGIVGYETIQKKVEKAKKKFSRPYRPYGKWIDKGEYAECSTCGAHSGTQFDGVKPIPLKTNYCPNCGANMTQIGGDTK